MDTNNMTAPEVTAPGTGAVTQTPNEPTTLADVLTEQPDQPPVTQPPQQSLKEPGYLAAKRAAWEAARQPELDALHAQINTLREYMINQEADKLVANGDIKNRDMAIEYLRAKQGLPVAQTETANNIPQRDAKGRFVAAPETVPSDIQQRAQTLLAQADKLSRMSGVDLMGLYNTDVNVRQKVIDGEWDFIDVLEHAKSTPEPAVPSPMRSYNGLGMGGMNFRSMTDDQFAKVNAMLAGGKKIDMRR